MGFSRQEYWSGLSFPSLGDLPKGIFPTQGSNPGLLHCRQMLYPLSHQGSPQYKLLQYIISNRHAIKYLPILDFPGGTVDRNPSAKTRDTGSIPGLGRFHMLRN